MDSEQNKNLLNLGRQGHISGQIAASISPRTFAQGRTASHLHRDGVFNPNGDANNSPEKKYTGPSALKCDLVNLETAAQPSRDFSRISFLLQKTSEAILFIDLRGLVVVANVVAQKIWNKDLSGKLFWDLFPDDQFGFSMHEALRYGIAQSFVYKTIAEKEFEITAFFFYEGPPIQHGLALKLSDITEKMRQKQLIARSDRLKDLGERVTKLSHEIRNPLGGIRGFSMLLYRDLVDQPHLQEMVGQIIEGTKSLERLVTSVLQYASPIRIELKTIDLSHFLKQIAKLIKADPTVPDTIHFQLHIPSIPILVPVDLDALKRAVLNMLINAIEAMPTGGMLTFSLFKINNACQISVSDSGMGMSETQLASLFMPLFTTKQTGSGLGLVETQKIVQAHGGTIQVRSTLGRGSTFTIELPLRR